MLTVVTTSMPASRSSEDVLPALLVATRARDVGVGELVHQGHLRVALEHGVEVHLLEAGAPVLDDRRGTTSRPSISSSVLLPPVALDEADRHVGAPLAAPTALVEHGVGLADAGRGAQVDPEAARPRPTAVWLDRPSHRIRAGSILRGIRSAATAGPWALIRAEAVDRVPAESVGPHRPSTVPVLGSASPELGERLVQLQDVDVAVPRKPSCAPLFCLAISARRADGAMPVALDTIGIWARASAGVMSGSSPLPEVVTRSAWG